MNEILEALKNKNYLVARTLLQNYGIDVSKYSNDLIDLYVNAILHSPYLQLLILRKFPVSSELPETLKISVPSYEKTIPNDATIVRKPTSRTVNPLLLERPVHNNVSTAEMVLGALPLAAAAYPVVAGSWAALPAIAKTAIGTGVSSYFLADGIRDIYEGHPNWETALKLTPGIGLAGKMRKALNWVDAIEATPIAKTNWYRGHKIALDLNNNIKGTNFINGEPIYNGGLRITSSSEEVPTVSKVVDTNGNIRLLLGSHTSGKPREFVLEPQGDNKYYVHMRVWDGKKIPGQISNEEKQALYDALYKELPDNAEILFPKSGEGYYGTRGTVAGLKHLERDSRFSKGSPGTLLYKDKDDVVKTFEGTSFIKNPTTSRFIFTPQLQSTIPIRGTSLAFFERPSTLTEVERLGLPKGTRNQNTIIQGTNTYSDTDIVKDMDTLRGRSKIPYATTEGKLEVPYDALRRIGIDPEKIWGPENYTIEDKWGITHKVRQPEILYFSDMDPYKNLRLLANTEKYYEETRKSHTGLELPDGFYKYLDNIKDTKPILLLFYDEALIPIKGLFEIKYINAKDIPTFPIINYRRYLESLGYKTDKISDYLLALVITDLYNQLSRSLRGLVKGKLFWHGTRDAYRENFDFKTHLGEYTGNVGAIGPGNYLSMGAVPYGDKMDMFLINDIYRLKGSKPNTNGETTGFPYRSPFYNNMHFYILRGGKKPTHMDLLVWDRYILLIEDYKKYIRKMVKLTRRNNTMYIDEHISGHPKLTDPNPTEPNALVAKEVKIQKDNDIKSLYLHPEAASEEGIVIRDWKDPRLHFALETPRLGFVQRPQFQTTVTVFAPKRFNIKTGKGSSIVDTHIARAKSKGAKVSIPQRYDLDDPKQLKQVVDYVKSNYREYANVSDLEIAEELLRSHYSSLDGKILYRSSQMDLYTSKATELMEGHEIEHGLHFPAEPVLGVNLKKLLPEGRDMRYWIKNNNTEIGTRIALILDYMKIRDARAFTGKLLKSWFKIYLKDPKTINNQMTKLYNAVTDWDALAKWASKPKNVYAILGLLGSANYAKNNF